MADAPKVVAIDSKQDNSVREILDQALSKNYDSVIVMGYRKRPGSYEITNSTGTSLMEEIGALECAKLQLLDSA